ncbi:MAG: nucleotide kinase [Thermoprotei archaeon]|mgnify:CR=1 FL=1|nr:MAG: nucleotide kinase [Thermoprotei archaeon]
MSSSKCIFLTGPPGIGKTTVILRTVDLLKKHGFSVGGMITREIRQGRSRVGFEIIDILTNRRGILAHIRFTSGPRVGKYRVNLRDLEEVGVCAIMEAIRKCDVVVIDEIGKMELFSDKFVKAVRTALSSGKIVLGTVHLRSSHPLAVEIREGRMEGVSVIYVTYQNRAILPEKILREVLSHVNRRDR